MIKNNLMFVIAAFMLLAFLPIIGSLATQASEVIEYETVTITITAGDSKTLTATEKNALLDVYNGDAYGLNLTFNNNTYVLVENYELVDPDHVFQQFGTDYELYDSQVNDYIFYFSIEGFSFVELANNSSFDYLGETVTINNPSNWIISFDIVTETSTASLNALIPIIAVLITITSIVVYYKFK